MRDEILSGRRPVGALLPPEAELCARFEVSRYTVREALRRLQEAGLVERRQGAGTQVVADRLGSTFVQSMRSLADLLQYAADTRLDVSKVRTAPLTRDQAAFIGAPAGAEWMRIDGVRRDGAGLAICAVTVLIDPRYADVVEDLATLSGSIFSRIEARYGVAIAEVVQEIGAGLMPTGVARALTVPPPAVGMRFRRRYVDLAGAAMLASFNWHPADRFVYAMHLKRGEE